MAVEDRLLVLLTQTRQQFGDAILADPAGLRSRLSQQAPDLHGEIQALAAAITGGAPARVGAAADKAAETQAIVNDIAARERLSVAVVRPAVEVACLAGIGAITPAPASAGGGWAGDSEIVRPRAPEPQPQPAYQPQQPYPPHPAPPPGGVMGFPEQVPFYRKSWFHWGAAAAVILAVVVGRGVPVEPEGDTGGNGPQPAPQPQPQPGPFGGNPGGGGPDQPQGPGTIPQPQPPGNGEGAISIANGPTLGDRNGAMPTLTPQRASNGSFGFAFTLPVNGVAPIRGAVILPANGWDAGQGTIVGKQSRPNGDAASVGSGRYERVISAGAPVRFMRPVWESDEIGAGPTCIAFAGAAGQQDVSLSGATMCIMDGGCNQALGCGRIQ